MRPLTVALLLAAIAAGCQYPRDPDGTLDRVEGSGGQESSLSRGQESSLSGSQ